ncbi:hypothetical protein AAF712_016119, partial [Marasmius tenuissimus]
QALQRQPNDPKEIIFLSDDYFLSASLDGMLTVTHSSLDGPSSSNTIHLPPGAHIRSLGTSKDRLACGLSDGRIMTWTVKLELLKQGQLEIHEEHTYDYHLDRVAPAAVTSVAFTDDLQHIVAGYLDGYIVVWYAGGMKAILHELSNRESVGCSDEMDRSHARVIFHQPFITHKPAADFFVSPGQPVTQVSANMYMEQLT